MGRAFVLILCSVLLFFWFMGEAGAETYYVALDGDDSNPGTIDEPWRTIKYAASVLVAGDTVLVRGGTYDEGSLNEWDRPLINPANSGTADAPITFKAYPGETVDINENDSGYYEIGSYKKNYIIWDGFIVRDKGVILYGESPRIKGCIIQNCIIEGAYVATGDNHDGIRIQNTSGAIVCDNIIRNVTGNSINSCGIKLYNTDNVLIEHNDIYGNTVGIFDKEEGTNNISRRNIIHNNSSANFLLHTQGGHSARGTEIYENIIYGSSTGFYVDCEEGMDIANTRIYSNVFVNGGLSRVLRAPNLQVWNNIFPTGYRCLVDGTPAYSEYNVFWTAQTFETGVYTPEYTVYNTFDQWNAGTGMDSIAIDDTSPGSRHQDPLFVDPANRDYHLQEDSPCKGTGKDGLDIGAYPRNDGTIIGPRWAQELGQPGQPQHVDVASQ